MPFIQPTPDNRGLLFTLTRLTVPPAPADGVVARSPFFAAYLRLPNKVETYIIFDHTRSNQFSSTESGPVGKLALIQCCRFLVDGAPQSPLVLAVHPDLPQHDEVWKRAADRATENGWFIDQVGQVRSPAYQASAVKLSGLPDVTNDDSNLFYTAAGSRALGMGGYTRTPYVPGELECTYLRDSPTFVEGRKEFEQLRLNRKTAALSSADTEIEMTPLFSSITLTFELQTYACNMDAWESTRQVRFYEGIEWQASRACDRSTGVWADAQVQFRDTIDHPGPEALDALARFTNA